MDYGLDLDYDFNPSDPTAYNGYLESDTINNIQYVDIFIVVKKLLNI